MDLSSAILALSKLYTMMLGFPRDILTFQIKSNFLADKLIGLPGLPSGFSKNVLYFNLNLF